MATIGPGRDSGGVAVMRCDDCDVFPAHSWAAVRTLQVALWAAEDEVAELRAALIEAGAETELLRGELAEAEVEPQRKRVRWNLDQSRFGRAKRMAVTRGKSWNLTSDQFYEIATQRCTYCGADTGTGSGLDRVDVSKGYDVSNVLPCCGRCNMTRGSRWTPSQMRTMMASLRSATEHGK